MFQKEISCCKKTETLTESLRSFVVKRNLLLAKDLDSYKEITKLRCKKKLAVGKRLRCFKRAYQVLFQKEIWCCKKTETLSESFTSCVAKRNFLFEKDLQRAYQVVLQKESCSWKKT